MPADGRREAMTGRERRPMRSRREVAGVLPLLKLRQRAANGFVYMAQLDNLGPETRVEHSGLEVG